MLEDADGILRDISVDFDPERLEKMEERLDLLYKLTLKYGDTRGEDPGVLEDCRAAACH